MFNESVAEWWKNTLELLMVVEVNYGSWKSNEGRRLEKLMCYNLLHQCNHIFMDENLVYSTKFWCSINMQKEEGNKVSFDNNHKYELHLSTLANKHCCLQWKVENTTHVPFIHSVIIYVGALFVTQHFCIQWL